MIGQTSEELEQLQLERQNSLTALKTRLVKRIMRYMSPDSHSLSFATYFMSQVVTAPGRCTVTIGDIEIPLEPLTEANLQLLRDTIVNGNTTVSLSFNI